MINVLIKGLDHIDDAEAIKSELALKGFVPHQIKKHVTGYMRKNNTTSNLWLIVLQPNTDTKELFKIKAIDHAIVKFEFLRKPKPGKCSSSTAKNKFKPKCVNCNGNHTANDASNCEVFKKVIASKESKQKTAKPVIKQSSLRSTQTYSEKLKAPVGNKPVINNQNTNIDKFMSNQNKMMIDFMATIQKMQQQFMSSFLNKNGR